MLDIINHYISSYSNENSFFFFLQGEKKVIHKNHRIKQKTVKIFDQSVKCLMCESCILFHFFFLHFSLVRLICVTITHYELDKKKNGFRRNRTFHTINSYHFQIGVELLFSIIIIEQKVRSLCETKVVPFEWFTTFAFQDKRATLHSMNFNRFYNTSILWFWTWNYYQFFLPDWQSSFFWFPLCRSHQFGTMNAKKTYWSTN